ARSWVYGKFAQYSAFATGRLIPSYLTFDQTICGVTKHKDIFAVLPGLDTTDHEIVLIEGHMDSRCEGLCDTSCIAEGIEDNATGTALVLELARTMSIYNFNKTIVFLITTGEEQGLYGAKAFANYANNLDLPIKAVYNNDVIGGIICGATSSGPSCPGLNDIDSTQVRLFSQGNFNSPHKQLSRFNKLQYKEELLPLETVPMLLTIMTNEDRIGRGGDHIPFRQQGFASMRFTSANEHGDASNGAGYTDRQHTADDVLGVDLDSNGTIDSFFVDFNYLARNAKINGIAAVSALSGPKTPTFIAYGNVGSPVSLEVIITSSEPHPAYRVALRTVTNDWDTVYTTTTTQSTFFPSDTVASWIVSVASVDDLGIESLFSNEVLIPLATIGLEEKKSTFSGVQLHQNRPNPFDESTFISVSADKNYSNKKASIQICDLKGEVIETLPIYLQEGMNEVVYEHGYGKVGTFVYTLFIDGAKIDSKRMVFAN
ncbi:MAG: M28 family peptidase, partial [Bacteroidota bacterium]